LQGLGFFDVLLGGIDSGSVNMIRVFLRFMFFLFGTLLDPVPLDLAELAHISVWGNAELFLLLYLSHGWVLILVLVLFGLVRFGSVRFGSVLVWSGLVAFVFDQILRSSEEFVPYNKVDSLGLWIVFLLSCQWWCCGEEMLRVQHK